MTECYAHVCNAGSLLSQDVISVVVFAVFFLGCATGIYVVYGS